MRRNENRAFTIMELLVAMALLVAMLAISGMVFKMAVDAHRRAEATAQVTRRLRSITDQLDADFKGLRSDCDIFIGWVPVPMDQNGMVLPSNTPPASVHHYAHFDKIMFFTNGNFQSYSQWPYNDPLKPQPNWSDYVTGNIARVCYSHAESSAGNNPINLPPSQRVMARSQHIYAPDYRLAPILDPTSTATLRNTFTYDEKTGYTNTGQYDGLDPHLWTAIPRPGDLGNLKAMMLFWTFGYLLAPLNLQTSDPDYPFLTYRGFYSTPVGGLFTDPTIRPVKNPHLLFSEGLGEFKIQCWHDYPNEPIPLNQQSKYGRWYPEMDPDGDGNLNDSDFLRLFPNSVGTGILGALYNGNGNLQTPPGPGRALKFTFTLYDSRGVFKDGKTFTHIVYLK